MKIAELLAKHPDFHLATPKDNEKILAFFSSIKMNTSSMEIRYDRSPDFFKLLSQQGYKSFVFLFDGKDGVISGISTIVLRKAFHEGKEIVIGYLSDLRVSPTIPRRMVVGWRKLYADTMDNYDVIDEFDGCQFMYSAILDENKNAINAFTRKDRESDIVYHALVKYEAINILGRIPLLRSLSKLRNIINSGLSIEKLQKGDEGQLRNFLYETNHNRSLGFFFTKNGQGTDELTRRLLQWDDLLLENFIVIKKNGQIVASVCPWKSSLARRLVISNLSFPLRVLGLLMPLFGKQKILENSELSVLYLSHFEVAENLAPAERNAIICELVKFVLLDSISEQAHMISFLNYPTRSSLPALFKEGYLYRSTPGTLYQVLSKRKFLDKKSLLEHRENHQVGLEL